jgi:hypothetical protein
MIFSENRFPLFRIMLLERAAASIAPDRAVGADAGARHHHDRSLDHDPGSYHDDAIGTASAAPKPANVTASRTAAKRVFMFPPLSWAARRRRTMIQFV